MSKDQRKSYEDNSKKVSEALGQYGVRHRMGIIIFGEMLVGINRLYIIGAKPLWINLVRMYSLALAIICVYVVLSYDSIPSTSFYVMKYFSCLEYLFLVVSAAFFQQWKFEKVLINLLKIDFDLGVVGDKYFLKAATRGLSFTFVLVLYNVIEFLWCKSLFQEMWNYDIYVIYIAMVAHDFEHIIFCYVMRSVLLRLELIKSHVKKLLKSKEESLIFSRDEPTDFLAKNVNIGIKSLYRIYDDLHTYSQELNGVMGPPVLMMLLTAGLTTIFFAKLSFHMLLIPPNKMINIAIGYHLIRCVQYTLTVLFPCVVAHSSKQAVLEIRAMLEDLSLSSELDSVDRRNVKTFIYLTYDSTFQYSLWGLVDLNMQLPLSYCSFCITYLVLFIQMSKFID